MATYDLSARHLGAGQADPELGACDSAGDVRTGEFLWHP